jgi:hypothetical protein
MADALRANKNIAAAAKKLKADDIGFYDAQRLYKLEARGGVGKAGPGIEVALVSLSKRALTAAELAARKADLERLAFLNLAMAEVTRAYAPKNGAAHGNRITGDMEQSTRDFLDAARKGDTAKLKKSAIGILDTCAACH